ncbi:MAG: hypothetical protein KDD40_00155 [Bdellovibrionales bacterium]|nr:hypothetical protein [Bdellovibrionales bacterium]
MIKKFLIYLCFLMLFSLQQSFADSALAKNICAQEFINKYGTIAKYGENLVNPICKKMGNQTKGILKETCSQSAQLFYHDVLTSKEIPNYDKLNDLLNGALYYCSNLPVEGGEYENRISVCRAPILFLKMDLVNCSKSNQQVVNTSDTTLNRELFKNTIDGFSKIKIADSAKESEKFLQIIEDCDEQKVQICLRGVLTYLSVFHDNGPRAGNNTLAYQEALSTCTKDDWNRRRWEQDIDLCTSSLNNFVSFKLMH